MTDTRQIQIAVLGGGCGALAAAYELTATPELRAKYAVTVYQQGWRLGGKGASGRNAAYGQRIEEHGLHMWMGFYENAFAMIRSVYAEWQKAPDNPFQSWTDAFTAQSNITLGEPQADGSWGMWQIPLPPMPGTPGDGGHFSQLAMAEALVKWLIERHADLGHAGAHRAAQEVQGHLAGGIGAAIHGAVAKVRAELSSIGGDISRIFLLLDLGWAVFKGLIEDVLPKGSEGFRAIDDLDFRDWVHGHGCSKAAANSAPVRALYDLGFAYAEGDCNRPSASAGVVLYVMLNIMFGSRGAALFRMNAGMGDTIFTPLYEVLKARGVRFEFFHRVEQLRLSPDRNLVAEIALNRQVEVAGDYDPLVPVLYGADKVLPCWPSEPQWGQIVDGAAIAAKLAEQQLSLENIWCSQSVGSRTLKLGRDFDHVVLGISLAGLRGTCDELIAAHPPFAAMVDNVATVQTQALQLWLSRDTAGMGWPLGQTVLTAYADPQSTWADMSHLLVAESWPGEGPQSIAYFCGPLTDAATAACLQTASPPACAVQVVARDGAAWLNANAPRLWPAAVTDGGFDWSVLYGSGGSNGPARLASQYVRANIDPTERYVLCLPGTVQYRLKSGQSGFANLFLAGDWVETRMNSGCVEGAVEGGMRAAQAISGYPQTIFGTGTEG